MQTPISKLNQDILWIIFLHVTEFQNLTPVWPNQRGPSPLTSLLHASQVCLSWRTLILNSSSLWGRVIDINSLYRSADMWKTEILQRTGKSCLHVKVLIRRDDGLQRFARTLLIGEWDRVRSLEIMFTMTLESQQELEKWRIFQTPAPKLECIYVDCTPPSRHTFANNFELFANDAPRLRHFSGLTLQINTGASWLSTLRYLRFTSSFTASELLGVLQRTPFLEELDVSTDMADCHVHLLGVTSLPQVVLSNLGSITMHTVYRPDSVPKYLDVLMHISPAPGCALFLPNLSIDPLPSNLQVAKRILQLYFQNFLRGVEAPTDLALHVTNSSFQMFSGPFSFDISCAKGFEDPAVFIEALSSSTYDRVKLLNFTTNSTALPPNNRASINIFSSLTSLERLVTDQDGLRHIVSLPWSATNIAPFPCLHTTILKPADPLDPELLLHFLNLVKPHIVYSESNLVLEIPVPQYRLRHCDLSCLERFAGLKITWGSYQDRTYICGSGNPQILNFTAT
ncbi:hypothetical protein CPB84DRAFT_1529207 [Gymnopilus junonius]|uniref:F-box domain-containing protein n=1 Tax=Gymnopilus junonius TaxID=109634 RepID=A0A9P5TK23_GYMJU|nr:hypothetical protein CPB84DRAFT_1529207 [Gymnopilus junonius]